MVCGPRTRRAAVPASVDTATSGGFAASSRLVARDLEPRQALLEHPLGVVVARRGARGDPLPGAGELLVEQGLHGLERLVAARHRPAVDPDLRRGVDAEREQRGALALYPGPAVAIHVGAQPGAIDARQARDGALDRGAIVGALVERGGPQRIAGLGEVALAVGGARGERGVGGLFMDDERAEHEADVV